MILAKLTPLREMGAANPFWQRILAFLRSAVLTCIALLLTVENARATENIIHVARHSGPTTLHPWFESSVNNATLHFEVFEGLITTGPTGEAIPGLAESWEASEDGLEYVFKIRDDAAWSDGTAITAEGIYQSFQMFLSGNAHHSSILHNVIQNAQEVKDGQLEPDMLGLDLLPDNKIRFRLNGPAPWFLDALRFSVHAPIPVHALDRFPVDTAWPLDSDVPTSGPYRVIDSQPLFLDTRKNANYHTPQNIKNDGFRFSWYPEDIEALFGPVRRGEFHIAYIRPSQQLDYIKKNFPEYLALQPSSRTDYYVFNTKVAPFDNVEIRRAMSMAIDHETGRVGLWNDEIQPMTTFVPEVSMHGLVEPQPHWRSWPTQQRLNAAREIMQDHGYSAQNPLKVDLALSSAGLHRRVANWAASQWRRIHIDVNFVVRSTSEHYQKLDTHAFQLARAGWAADIDDPFDYIVLFSSDNTYNYGLWSNAEYDELLVSALKEPNRERRNQYYAQALQIFHDEAAAIPTFSRRSIHLLSPKLKGVREAFHADHYFIQWVELSP